MTSTIEHPPPSLSFRRLSSTDTRTFLYVNDSPVLEAHRTYETKHLDPSEFWKLIFGKPAGTLLWAFWHQINPAGKIVSKARLVKLPGSTIWFTATEDAIKPEEILAVLDESTHFRIM